MKIRVNYIPSEHIISLFWWKDNHLTGIAEWEEEKIDLDHEAELANDNYEGNYE